jgi:hypothetical protein
VVGRGFRLSIAPSDGPARQFHSYGSPVPGVGGTSVMIRAPRLNVR